MHIIDRASWGARYADGDDTSTLPARYVYLHHSATVAPDLVQPFTDDDAAVRELERIGQQRFGSGISYTFAVTPIGRVYEGHSVERQGTHTKNLNDAARAIVLVGNYDRGRVHPQQIEAVAQLLVHGWRKGWWQRPEIEGGHRDAPGASTDCPGDYAEHAIPSINHRAAQIAAGDHHDQEDEHVTISSEDARKIARAVWAENMGATSGGGIDLPELTAGQRLDAIHRLAALAKKRHGEIAAAVAALDPEDVAELVPVEIAAEVVALLGRRLYAAAPPAKAKPAAVHALVAQPAEPDGQLHELVHDVDEHLAVVEPEPYPEQPAVEPAQTAYVEPEPYPESSPVRWAI